jgi:hypothetical protein
VSTAATPATSLEQKKAEIERLIQNFEECVEAATKFQRAADDLIVKGVTLQRALDDALTRLREQHGAEGVPIMLATCQKMQQMITKLPRPM